MPRKKTHEEFVEEVELATKGEYTVLGVYINNMKNVLMRHDICGYEWSISRANFINQNKRCPKCKRKILSDKFSKTHDRFLEEVYNLYKDEYTILGEYKGSHIYVEALHNICGEKYNVTPTNLLSGKKCPNCKWNVISKKRTKGLKQFKKDVYERVGDEYLVIGNYKNNKTYTTMAHVCGNIYEVTPDAFLNGNNRCPKCSSSKGENLIHEYLIRSNINYKSQYSFEDCKYKNQLPFDFAIFDEDDILQFLIEYDGIQHFEPREYFGGEEEFKKTKIRDRIKDEYCKNNKIKLIRISYWDFENIKHILDDLF